MIQWILNFFKWIWDLVTFKSFREEIQEINEKIEAAYQNEAHSDPEQAWQEPISWEEELKIEADEPEVYTEPIAEVLPISVQEELRTPEDTGLGVGEPSIPEVTEEIVLEESEVKPLMSLGRIGGNIGSPGGSYVFVTQMRMNNRMGSTWF